MTLLGRTTETGPLAGDAAKVALAAETLDRVHAIAAQAVEMERETSDRLWTSPADPEQKMNQYRLALVQVARKFDTVKSLIEDVAGVGLSHASPWEPKVDVVYGVPTGAGTYETYTSADLAFAGRDGFGYITGEVTADAPPVVRITTVEVYEPDRAEPRRVHLRPAPVAPPEAP